MTNTATQAAYQLRKAIQVAREAGGLGDVRMWNETPAAFDAFMAEYKAEAPKPKAKVVFVKQYTINASGRAFRRYAIAGAVETVDTVFDVLVRTGRGEVHILTNAEAKAEAERILLAS